MRSNSGSKPGVEVQPGGTKLLRPGRDTTCDPHANRPTTLPPLAPIARRIMYAQDNVHMRFHIGAYPIRDAIGEEDIHTHAERDVTSRDHGSAGSRTAVRNSLLRVALVPYVPVPTPPPTLNETHDNGPMRTCKTPGQGGLGNCGPAG